jgi:hypothetical protein
MADPKQMKKKYKKELKKIEERIILKTPDELNKKQKTKSPEDPPVEDTGKENGKPDKKNTEINRIMKRILLKGIFEETKESKKEKEGESKLKKDEPKETLSKDHRADLIESAETNFKRGDSISLQQSIEYYEKILRYENGNKEIIKEIDNVYRKILQLPESKNDLNVWVSYAEFCQEHNELKQAVKIFRGISEDLRNKLETVYQSISKKRNILTLNFDLDKNVVTANLKGEVHYTKTFPLNWDTEDIEKLQREARRVDTVVKSECFSFLKDVGDSVYKFIIHEKGWLDMFKECYNKKGIIEFKIKKDYIEFPVELLLYDDFIAVDMPIRKHLLNFGEHIRRRPLSAEFYTGEPLKALLVASGVDGLTEVNGEIKKVAGLLLDEQNLFNFETITCLTDDKTIEKLDSRIKRLEPTARNFRNELESEEGGYHLLHYAGHGFFQEADADINCGLVFEDDQINLVELKASLQRSSLRFIYFNSCKSGQQSSRTNDSIFLGNARTSLIGGVPSVLVMRWSIYDHSAKMMAEHFYESFCKNGYPEFAIQECKRFTREKLYKKDKNDISWAAPMLIIH